MFDNNNNYTGTFFGKDRLGFTTPDLDASDPLRPFLPIPYPAPWLPARRRDEGHPVGAGVVISAGYAVGLDVNGLLVPAGMLSGSQAVSAFGDLANYCLVQYSADDVGFATNPATGAKVAAAGEYVLLACPSNAAVGTVVDGIAITQPDIDFAKTCTLIPGGRARTIGYAIRNVFQYLGGVTVSAHANGILYTVQTEVPTGFAVHNYMHEMGTAIQTHMVLRMPWIGATPATLAALAATDSITGYAQTDFSRSFTHMVGDKTAALDAGGLALGCAVVASSTFGAKDAGHYAPYNSTKHSFADIIGKVIGFENMNPVRGYADRIRTQFDRAEQFVGPFADRNPVTFQMGGSATRGMDYQLNLSSNGLFRKSIDQGKTPHDESTTYALVYFRV